MQFLDQLIYTGNNICANVLPTETLADADEYFGEDCWTDDAAEVAQTVKEAENMCLTCFVNPKDTAFLPCKHVCCCFDCAERWKKVNVATFDAFVHLDEEDINEDLDALVDTENLQPASCPICRTEIESTMQLFFT